MSAITEESARKTILHLTGNLSRAKADAARAEGRLDCVRSTLVHALWETEAAPRAGTVTMPTAEVALLLHRLWDVATMGADYPPREGMRP